MTFELVPATSGMGCNTAEFVKYLYAIGYEYQYLHFEPNLVYTLEYLLKNEHFGEGWWRLKNSTRVKGSIYNSNFPVG